MATLTDGRAYLKKGGGVDQEPDYPTRPLGNRLERLIVEGGVTTLWQQASISTFRIHTQMKGGKLLLQMGQQLKNKRKGV